MELMLILGISVLGLLFALYLMSNVLRRDTGTEKMREISDAIKAGAEAFMRRQYRTIIYFAVALACAIYILYAFVRAHNANDPASPAELALWTTLSFVLGALCSAAAGYMGMWVAIRSNIRTAAGATRDMNSALQPALRGGAVSGFFVVALSLLGVAGLFAIVEASGVTQDIAKIPLLIVGYGFGASFVALFAQLGGGIYTKAADVGADLVGKVEAGIPEDDPRNPAVIADLVGDNVGDCAGRGADLFESTAAENIGAMILAAGLFAANKETFAAHGLPLGGVIMFPLVARAFGIIASALGILAVKANDKEDPMKALNRGFYVTAFIAMIGFYVASRWLLGSGVLFQFLPLRTCRRADIARLRAAHHLLYRLQIPAGPLHRRGIENRAGNQHHQRYRGRHGIHGISGAGHRIGNRGSILSRINIRSGTCRIVRNRRRDDGYARNRRLRARHGYVSGPSPTMPVASWR